MDNNTYILTSDGELYHYGVPGMKWGVRRTPAQLGHQPSTKSTASGKSGGKSTGKSTSKTKKMVNNLIAKHKAKRLTKKEEKRAAKSAKKALEEARKQDLANRNKKVSEMSDAELIQHLYRVRMERDAYQIDADIKRLNPEKVSAGKKFANEFKEKALSPAAMEAGRKLMTSLMNKAVDKALGDAKDPFAALANEAKKAGYDKTIAEARKAIAAAEYQELLTKEKRKTSGDD